MENQDRFIVEDPRNKGLKKMSKLVERELEKANTVRRVREIIEDEVLTEGHHPQTLNQTTSYADIGHSLFSLGHYRLADMMFYASYRVFQLTKEK